MKGTSGPIPASTGREPARGDVFPASGLREALNVGGRDAVLRALADVVHAAIYVKDREGRYLFVNRFAEALFPRSAEGIVGHRDEEIFGPEAAHCIQAHDRRVLDARAPIDAEAALPHRDGTIHVYRTLNVPLLPEDGTEESQPWGVCGVLTDITSQKAGLARLEKAVQERERVLRVVSHDLKTPLTALRIGIGALRKHTASEAGDMGRHLDLLDRAVTRMQRLISDVLDATRGEQGRLPVALRPAAVSELLREAAEGHHWAASARQVRIILNTGRDKTRVHCDPDRVSQILANLLDNALRFSPAGGEIVLRAEPRGEFMCIMVDDSGPGVPAEVEDRIFSAYTSAPGPDGQASTGLGLYIARSLVEAQGGLIWVERAPTGGARFAFTLPFWHEEAAGRA